MKDNLTEIVAILDRSGSMAPYIKDNIGGFNRFVKEQREQDGEANLTLTIFDNEHTLVHDGININDVPELTSETYFARNWTALYDAICTTIDRVGQRLSNMAEEDRPSQVIVLIMTDGAENASTEFTVDNVRQRIETQQNEYNWKFTFIGANQDAILAASNLGIHANSALNNSQAKYGQTYSLLSQTVSTARATKGDISYSDTDRNSVI